MLPWEGVTQDDWSEFLNLHEQFCSHRLLANFCLFVLLTRSEGLPEVIEFLHLICSHMSSTILPSRGTEADTWSVKFVE